MHPFPIFLEGPGIQKNLVSEGPKLANPHVTRQILLIFGSINMNLIHAGN